MTKPDNLLVRVTTDIGIVAQHQDTIMTRLLPEGLTPAQYGVLNRLVRLEAKETLTMLAEAFAVSKPTMSSTISKLAAKGMVELLPDPSDGRRRTVVLTPSGREAWEDGAASAARFAAPLLGALDEKEWHALASLLQRIRETLDGHMKREKGGLPLPPSYP